MTAYQLAGQCFNILKDQTRTIASLASLVRDAECYRLIAGDLDGTCELVDSLRRSNASKMAG